MLNKELDVLIPTTQHHAPWPYIYLYVKGAVLIK